MIARYENEYNSLADQDVKWQTELARYAEAKAKLEKEELEQQENLRKAGADSAEKQRLMETPSPRQGRSTSSCGGGVSPFKRR